jgi:hypothetical protein
MPNIIMRIAVDYRNKTCNMGNWPYNSCHLYLHHPTSARLVFFILETPVFLREADDKTLPFMKCHDDCRPLLGYLGLGYFEITPSHPPSEVQPTAASTSPVLVIEGISLYPGASLLSESARPTRFRHRTFELTAYDANIVGIGHQIPCEARSIATVIELLKLRGMQTYDQPSADWLKNHDPDRQAFIPCIPRYAAQEDSDCHVAITLCRASVESFMNRASPYFCARMSKLTDPVVL